MPQAAVFPDLEFKLMRFFTVALLLTAAELAAQTSSVPGSLTNPSRTIATAHRMGSQRIDIDGKPDEAAWAAASPLTDFKQKEPVEGAVPSDLMDVRFLYDDDAMYVGIRVSTNRRSIQAPVTRRDNISSAEHVWVSFDSYRDRRTAYTFGVTASGVRGDWYHPTDNERHIDPSFDPVWEAAASISDSGWTAEMRIPFSQLRFNASDTQVWGININHWVPSLNEDVFWIPVPRDASGWSSRMGTLVGLEGIKPSRRLEVVPYVASDATMRGDRDLGNPFDDGRNLSGRIGGDLKMGLGPSLTLQATANPDFGQVEADPAEVNLSAFETFFSERRPFFIENSRLLTGAGSYFYSRRIGARPRGDASGDYVDYPGSSTILGAAKLTGRLSSGTSIGALAAVTANEQARLFDAGSSTITNIRVTPRTGYGVGRVQQEFGANASTLGFTLTGVQRDLAKGDALANLLTRTAYSGGVDLNYRFAGGTYSVDALGGFSQVNGDSAAILRLQRSSARYFQRPDAKSYRVDSMRTSLAGANGRLSLRKNDGEHWLGNVSTEFKSPGFELNDAGRLGRADEIEGSAEIEYRETNPGPVFRNYEVKLGQQNSWNYDRNREASSVRAETEATLGNFWRIDFNLSHDFSGLSERLTRGGPLMRTGSNNVANIRLSNSFAASTRWNARLYYGKDEFGAPTSRISGGVSIRPTPQWQLSIDPNYLRTVDTRQYVSTISGGPQATFGQRYVFGRVDRAEFFADLRASYTFRPDLSLEVYARPFAASGTYSKIGQLRAARTSDLLEYGTEGTSISKNPDGGYQVVVQGTGGAPSTFSLGSLDYNIRSVRSNMVMRWEYRPGSTLFVVWQQNRQGFDDNGRLVRPGDLFGGYSNPGTNYFAIKASFWLPVL